MADNILIHQDSELTPNGLTNWTLKLERLRVADAQEESFLSNGDEPYFIAVGFRSRFQTAGSTQVFLNDFDDDDWAGGVDDGDQRNIPSSMGTLNFSNVETLSATDILAGKKPELVGAIVIAMESDLTPWRIIRNIASDLRSSLQAELTKLIEQGGLNLANPGPDIAAAIERVKSSIEPSFLGKISIALQSLGDPDDTIGIHSFLFAGVDQSLSNFISLSGLSNATAGVLQDQRFDIGSDPIVFRGNGATYEVTTSLSSTPARFPVAGGAEAGDLLGHSVAVGNFDGSQGADLAVGAIGEDIGTIADAGSANVLYSDGAGISGVNNQIWHQDSPGIQGGAEAGDRFADSLATGDFNGDGRDDLAAGVTGEDIGSISNAGAVNVLYGSASGLTAIGDQIWHQDTPGVEGGAEAGDAFGKGLVAGDFNGDGRDDLAIGVTGEDIGSISNAGAVNVLYGSVSGLSATSDQIWHQDTPGVQGGAEAGDLLGGSLAAGDFNGDGRDDLAIGATGEDIGSISNAGSVNVLYGSVSGLSTTNNQIWHQDTPGVQGGAEANDFFGRSVAAGDFNGDGRDDLAVGVSGEDIGSISNAGAVNILYGSNTGLSTAGNQIWHQDTLGIQGGAEADDLLGSTVAVGDFNGDGRDDLAIGAPGEDIGSISSAGAVNVIYGSNAGLTATNNQIWHQDTPGVQGGAEASDFFGSSLSVGDFNRDGFEDLAIGASGEDIGSIANAGSVQILFGSRTGLTV